MTLRSRLLHITAVDVAVVGLQKRPISSIVPRVGIFEVLDCILLELAVFAELLSRAASSVSSAVVVTALGAIRVAVLALGTVALGAVITALTAAIFAFNFSALSRHFFFWLRLPCPGPGMLGVKTERK
jgi:hypothetical protein